MMLTVMKFGGTSLADAGGIRRAAERIASARAGGARVAAVVSARGDTTDRLLAQARQICPTPSGRELDACLAAGEQVSAALLAMALEQRGIPAVSLTGAQAGICTDGVHGNARITGLRDGTLREILEENRVPVTAGFQGIGPDGAVTTLGRGGSDTTAVALAAFLGAEQCLICTDVEGICDRDPRVYPDAVPYARMGYEKALELIRGGARVLHDRSVELARQYHVKIRVLSSFRPGQGTLVGDTE